MEKKMETTVAYWGYIEIMKKKMETTIGLVVSWGDHQGPPGRRESLNSLGFKQP